MDSADKLAELIRAEQEKTAAKERAKANAPQRSEFDKLLRLVRWVIIGAVVVYVFRCVTAGL